MFERKARFESRCAPADVRRRSPKNLFTAAGSKSAAFQLPRVESRIFERPRGGRAGLGRFDKTWIDAGTRHGLPRVTVNGISPLHGHAQPHSSSPSITISTLIPSRLVSLGPVPSPQFPRPSSRHAAKKGISWVDEDVDRHNWQ